VVAVMMRCSHYYACPKALSPRAHTSSAFEKSWLPVSRRRFRMCCKKRN
jgi:hypothetical protein